MKRIQFDRISFDGSRLSQSDLEEWYDKDNELSNAIKKRLEKICPTQENVKALLKEITEKVHDFLLYSPEKLAQYVETKKELSGVFMDSSSGESTDFGKQVLDAFNYSNYRKKKLVELAKKLNVKSCPYCNMHYTLYAEEGEQESEKLAKFQFDHFFSKSKYPMLSMSLYNLIPSCALCNQGKSKRNLTLSFHPYHSDICKQFKFELDNPIDLYCGRKTYDYIDVNLKAVGSNQEELDEFVKTFHLRHFIKDMVMLPKKSLTKRISTIIIPTLIIL